MLPKIKVPGMTSKVKPTLSRSSSNSGGILLKDIKPRGWFEISSASHVACEEALRTVASRSPDDAISMLESSISGLKVQEVDARLEKYGRNILSSKKAPTWWQMLLSTLCDWFICILVVIAIVTAVLPDPEYGAVGIIGTMILISCFIRFWQERHSAAAAIKLQDGISASVRVQRWTSIGSSTIFEVDQKDLVPGDIIFIDPGNIVPVDGKVIHASNLSISQSSLTGENEPQRKFPVCQGGRVNGSILDLNNILFMGTNVISGSGLAVVLRTGDNAFLATIMKELSKKRPQNAFQRGVKHLSWASIAVILVACPIVWGVSWKSTGKCLAALYFAVSVAVGLIPQLLPAIINSNLARGACVMHKKGAVVKNLTSIQNLGAATVICSDKTGTLTKDEITLRHYLDHAGNACPRVFELAHTNAVSQSGAKNSIDSAILKHPAADNISDLGVRIGEIAFTFETRRSSAIIRTKSGQNLLICKGACEEVFSLCSNVNMGGQIVPLNEDHARELDKRIGRFNDDGFRVVLVATKQVDDTGNDEEESYLDVGMTVEGILTFLDPPKDDAKASIARLQQLGIDVRVLTGDNIKVAMKVCRDLEIVKHCDEEHIQAISGPDLYDLRGDEFHKVVKHCKIFAKLTPSQKGKVIESLQKHGEVVGMLGDGINDSVALRAADAGISVDTGTNVAKDCADMILTKKSLSTVVDCAVVGRTTQGNTIKYIKVVFSSNFGNIISVLIASAWLPYQPMLGLQLLTAGVLYECSQLAIPWDTMDPEYLAVPTKWCIKDFLRFVLIQGPLSTLVDISTFCLNWYYYKLRDSVAAVRTAQTHWYLQGLLTQVLIVHFIRTSKIPIIQSRPAKPLVISSAIVLAIGFSLPYIQPIAKALEFARPENSMYGFLAAELVGYALAVEVTKRVQIRVWGRWL